ncbi:MAG: cytochrome c, partial [Opitutae bacterium]|nr:cytochrome c [Opitutae bacterium]
HEWQRAHLGAPRSITPGSRMPSYAHLFAGDGARGETLLAFLDSLGGETIVEHQEAANAWRPVATAQVADAAAQRRLFAQWCAGCHGESGRGDGPVAAQLANQPRDLTRDAWRFVPAGADETLALARVIKFGVPGTAMAGREYLPDEVVLSLAAYLQTLRKISNTTAPH